VDGSAQPAAPRADLASAALDKILDQNPPQQIPLQAQAPAPQGKAAGVAQVAQADQSAARVHVVKKGETLGGISAKYLGSSAKWKFILEANRDIINKPEDLRIGMKLSIPSLDTPSAPAAAVAPALLTAVAPAPAAAGQAAQPAAAAGAKFYDVERGDSLWLIAKKVYGNANDWKKIQEANKDQLGESGKALKPGMRLLIP
jgi:nucleoid-associated protein YgaU